VLWRELEDGGDKRLRSFKERLLKSLQSSERNDESLARTFARDLVLALQAALLVKHASSAVADAFCASRLDGESNAFGLLPRGLDLRAIIGRAGPV
jgi:putative acyl-CoA dehydrogenase